MGLGPQPKPQTPNPNPNPWRPGALDRHCTQNIETQSENEPQTLLQSCQKPAKHFLDSKPKPLELEQTSVNRYPSYLKPKPLKFKTLPTLNLHPK